MHQTIAWMTKVGMTCVWVAFHRHASKTTTITSRDGCIFHTYSGYPSEAQLLNIEAIYRPDVIHLQGPIVYMAVPLFKARRISLLIGFHFWTGILQPNDEGGFNNRRILDRTDNHLDALCQDDTSTSRMYVASDFINQVIAHVGGRPIKSVIYPIPPRHHYTASKLESTGKEEIQAGDPGVDGAIDWSIRPNITCININRGKGGDLVLDIVSALPDLPFLAVCNEPNTDDLDDRIARNINGRVLTYTDIKSVYATTRLLLVPSHVDETFSRVAYEGAALGIPIITLGSGFIRQLLGDAGVYVSADPSTWILTIRSLYQDIPRLDDLSRRLRHAIARLPDPEAPLVSMVQDLIPRSSRSNILIIAPWCDQGLGHQAKLYSQILRRREYRVHILSFLSYFCLDRDETFRLDPSEWQDYDSLYESYNTREELTPRELRQIVMARNIGTCLIPEICFSGIFATARLLRDLHVKVMAIPNIEICRRDEFPQYSVFTKILAPTRQCYRLLNERGLPNVEYIGHCLPQAHLVPRPPVSGVGPLRFLHVSGYNAMTRKQTRVVIDAFRQARDLLGDRVMLTVTSSRPLPVDILGKNGIDMVTSGLSHSNIMDMYARHDVSIQIGTHEGLGLGFYESIHAGTPIISMDQAPHNEVVIPEQTGWLIPSTPFVLTDNNQAIVEGGRITSSALAEVMIRLACHPEEVRRVTQRLSGSADRWSRQRFGDRLVEAIHG